MFLSNYLQMMYDKLNMIKQVSSLLEWIVLIDYFCKDDQFPCPWCKIVLKLKNMINEDKRESSIIRKRRKNEFWWMITIFFWLDSPYENDQKPKNVKQFILINVQNNVFGDPFYLRNIYFFVQILRALLSNKNGILHFWKIQ